ncbi:hypothetical protein ACQPYE_28380 [Actinosynnema sp. CA-299493]
MPKTRLLLAAFCASLVFPAGTASATDEERVLNTTECEEYLCINIIHSDRFVNKVEVYQNGDGPNWYGHVGFTSNTLPHQVGPDGNPVPWVVVEPLQTVREGTDLCGEAWEKHGAGYRDVGHVCVRL